MMQGKNLNSIILALLLALVFIIPAFAEEETIPPVPEPDLESSERLEDLPADLDDIQVPEDIPEPGEGPLPEAPQDPSEEQDPEDIQKSDEGKKSEDVQKPDEGQEPEDAQEPSEEQDSEDIQEPEDDIQAPNGEQSPDEEEPEEELEEPQEPDEEPGLEEEQILEEELALEEDPLPEEELEPDEPADIVIEVTVPSNGQIIINPYHVKVDTGYGTTQEQIIHPFQTLENNSSIPVLVHVRAVGTIPEGSEVSFVDTTSLDAQSKDVFLYVEFQDDSGLWMENYVGASNQVIIMEQGDVRENVLLLEAFGEGYFQLFGEMSDAPDSPWEPTDTFGAVLTFTFSAVPTEPEDEVSTESLGGIDSAQDDSEQSLES